jgi:hypothetical protein
VYLLVLLAADATFCVQNTKSIHMQVKHGTLTAVLAVGVVEHWFAAIRALAHTTLVASNMSKDFKR